MTGIKSIVCGIRLQEKNRKNSKFIWDVKADKWCPDNPASSIQKTPTSKLIGELESPGGLPVRPTMQ